MDDRQQRLWGRMLRAVSDNRMGKVSLRQVVAELEGAVDAGEFVDRDLLDAFYERWGPLEIWISLHRDGVRYDQARGEVDSHGGIPGAMAAVRQRSPARCRRRKPGGQRHAPVSTAYRRRDVWSFATASVGPSLRNRRRRAGHAREEDCERACAVEAASCSADAALSGLPAGRSLRRAGVFQ